MAVRVCASPIRLSPHRLFFRHQPTADGDGGGGGGGYLSLRRHPPPSLLMLRCSNLQRPSAVRSSQDTAVFLSDVGPSEALTSVDTVEHELDSSQLSIWKQMKELAMFAGPATGLWISGPLMSLIDTMVIGQASSIELAALGPGTVFCDYLSYIFMFLSISTSSMVATSLAKKDNVMAQNQISMLLFVAFTSGLGMFLFTKLFGLQILTAFSGSGNMHLVTAANSYIQIRGIAWPAILVGMVAQSASLGMKDSWGPLKALVVASAVNGFGDVILCSMCGYGIAGAAWATMFSQIVAAFMMMTTLNYTGFRAFSISIPSRSDLFQVYEIAAPVFVTMTSKVAFYSLLTYFATSMGTITVAAHQVMINALCMCTVWGEPLSQSAQSFMPELIHGANRSLFRLASSRGFGLPGCWWGLAIFQWGRFSMALQRLTIPHGMLYNEQFHQREHEKLKGA